MTGFARKYPRMAAWWWAWEHGFIYAATIWFLATFARAYFDESAWHWLLFLWGAIFWYLLWFTGAMLFGSKPAGQ